VTERYKQDLRGSTPAKCDKQTNNIKITCIVKQKCEVQENAVDKWLSYL